MAVNYVKFYRGTKASYEALGIKNTDTLYFITDSNSNKGELYLGDKLISADISSITDLADIILTNIEGNDILVYNAEDQKWENKSVYDVVETFIGATETEQGDVGLVPAPGIGQQNYFLRGDGTWAIPEGSDSGVDWIPDGNTIQIVERPDGEKTLSLRDFSKGYYAYTENGYVYTTDGFKEGLEARVVVIDGYYCLAWYEPNPTSVDDIGALVAALQADLDALEQNTYTKVEIDTKITNAAHLKRVIVESVDDIDPTADDADQYIYMVHRIDDKLNDKYEEYMVIDGSVEKLGSWEVDLSDYVTKVEIAEERAKLATIEEGAQKNYISSVESNFNVDETGKLSLVDIPNNLDLSQNETVKNLKTKVVNIENILNDNSETGDPGLITRVVNLENTVQNLSDNYVTKTLYQAQVGNLDNLIHATGQDSSTLVDEINFINERLQWHEISESN